MYMAASTDSNPSASCEVSESEQELEFKISGYLTVHTITDVWKDCSHQVQSARHKKNLVIDAAGVRSCNVAGVGLLSYLVHLAEEKNISVKIVNLREEFQQLLDEFASSASKEPIPPAPDLNIIEAAGKFTLEMLDDFREQVTFLGRVLITGLRAAVQPWRFRWQDFFHKAEAAGVHGVGIVSLLGFLFGLIMAFSSAMPLRQFGVEIYVTDLVGYAMVRVLGPILTAIIVAGRTGSAFAAELGTMKINHEIDALKVMNMDPVRFLVIPRILATTLMTPLLAVAACAWGLIGSAVVILSLNYSIVVYNAHLQSILSVPDIIVGLVKSIVYGAMIGTVGCLRGMQTKIGADAVGVSTTRAVVTAIIMLVILEGIFSVLLYFLEI
jgi:phospholipid/cholesterol/gamma-HCH transport system permease protein